jgi:hypothetical protein
LIVPAVSIPRRQAREMERLFYIQGGTMKKLYDDALLKKFGQQAVEDEIASLTKAIEESNKESFDEEIIRMEARYIVCVVGSKLRIIDKLNPMGNQLSVDDAKDFFMTEKFTKHELVGMKENKLGKLVGEIEKKTVPIFPIWFQTADRYNGLVMKPSQKSGEIYDEKQYFRYYNIWRGWAVKPDEKGCCDLFTDMVLNDICNGNLEAYQYLMDYLADMIQHPDSKNPKIIVIQGSQGTFKTTAMDVMTHLMGSQYAVTLSNHMLTSNFNSMLFGKILAIADEAVWAGQRDQWGKLKALTGNVTLPVEAKGKDVFIADNYIHLMCTTNEEYSFPNEQSNRRSVYYKTSAAHINDSAYRTAILDQLKDGGYERLMWELQNRKINSNFYGPCPVFSPESFEDTRLESLTSENTVVKWVYESFMGICSDSCSIFYKASDASYIKDGIYADGEEVKASSMFSRYNLWVEKSKEPKIIPSNVFGRKLSQICRKKRYTAGMFYSINRVEMQERAEKILGFKLAEADDVCCSSQGV